MNTTITQAADIDYNLLIDCIAVIESNNDPCAYNLKENAAGLLQIRPVMLEEVNAICKQLGLDINFTLQDRFDPKQSRRMAHIYFRFLSRLYKRQLTVSELARCWNGGRKGLYKKTTIWYGKKAEDLYNQRIRERYSKTQ